ncbi:MAG: thymidylate kinase [Actinomycetota bacterium]
MTGLAYIAFEGIEGCGKSTQATTLVERLTAAGCDVVATRETGGTAIGSRIRDVLHDPTNTHLDSIAEALLIAGDRAQHRAEVLSPALSSGRLVVSDRSVHSTIAYQGYGRELPLDMVRTVNDWALGGRWPDLVILLDISHVEAMTRLRSRNLDRFEQEDESFFLRVRNGFHLMAEKDPSRWVVIDAMASRDDIAADVWRTVAGRLGL